MVKRRLEQIYEALRNEKIALCEDNAITAVAIRILRHAGTKIEKEQSGNYLLLKVI